MENNLAPNTQIGRIIIDEPVGLFEHPDMFSNDDAEAKYSRGGEFLENYMSANILEFCRRWMGLGDIYDIEEDLREFYSNNFYNGPGIDYQFGDCIYDIKDDMINAVEFIDGTYINNFIPAVYFDNSPDIDMMEDLTKRIREKALL